MTAASGIRYPSTPLYPNEITPVVKTWRDSLQGWDRGYLNTVLAQLRRFEFHGLDHRTLIATADGEPVSMNLFHIGKRKRGVWGRYVNVYYAFTLPHLRRHGIAKRLFKGVEACAIQDGAHRLKSLAGTHRGFLLHASMHHTFWGLDGDGHIIVDHPLVMEFALQGVPIQVLKQKPDAQPCDRSAAERMFLAGAKGRAETELSD